MKSKSKVKTKGKQNRRKKKKQSSFENHPVMKIAPNDFRQWCLRGTKIVERALSWKLRNKSQKLYTSAYNDEISKWQLEYSVGLKPQLHANKVRQRIATSIARLSSLIIGLAKQIPTREELAELNRKKQERASRTQLDYLSLLDVDPFPHDTQSSVRIEWKEILEKLNQSIIDSCLLNQSRTPATSKNKNKTMIVTLDRDQRLVYFLEQQRLGVDYRQRITVDTDC